MTRLVIGFTVLGVGIVLLILPGPAIVVIPIGLAILATELAWAKRMQKRVRDGAETIGQIFGFKKMRKQGKQQEKQSAEKT